MLDDSSTNKYQNSDLFWALRGGGESTSGIVTLVTYRTYPIVPIQVWEFLASITNSSVFPELVEGFLRYQIQFTDNGRGGYGFISNQGISFQYFSLNMTNETVTTTTRSWLNLTQSVAPYGVVSWRNMSSISWNDLIHQMASDGGPGGGTYALGTSRLLAGHGHELLQRGGKAAY
ncbi:hypothetical protein V8E55_012227 [Tylopilus felleus]